MRAGAAEAVDLVLLEQEGDAVDVGVDALPSLCVIIAARSGFGLPTSMPSLRKVWPASSNISEACSSAFEGMQPTLRQVPPRVACFSTTATLRPSWAARMAQT